MQLLSGLELIESRRSGVFEQQLSRTLRIWQGGYAFGFSFLASTM